MEPKHRRLSVLAAIIESYVETGEPVGSKTLAAAIGNCVSSATIRNDMAALAESGYLEQPHTSAGRIPTQRGYRLYVDRLMSRRTLPQETMHSIDLKLTGYSLDPEGFLLQSSRMLSEMTGMAAVTTTPADEEAKVVNIELMAISRQTCLLVMMFTPTVLKSRMCRLDLELTDETVNALRGILREYLLGRSIGLINHRLVSSVKAMLGEFGSVIEPLLTAAREAAREAGKAQVVLYGQSKLIEEQVSNEKTRAMLSFLSDRKQLAELLCDARGTMNVFIGDELRRPALDHISMITARYRGGIGAAGWVGVIGPMRMSYARIIPHIEYFATAVGRVMSAMEADSDDKL